MVERVQPAGMTGQEGLACGPAVDRPGGLSYFRAVTVISMCAAGDASFVTPTVVRAGRGSAKYLV